MPSTTILLQYGSSTRAWDISATTSAEKVLLPPQNPGICIDDSGGPARTLENSAHDSSRLGCAATQSPTSRLPSTPAPVVDYDGGRRTRVAMPRGSTLAVAMAPAVRVFRLTVPNVGAAMSNDVHEVALLRFVRGTLLPGRIGCPLAAAALPLPRLRHRVGLWSITTKK